MSQKFDFGKWLTNPLPGEEIVISGVSGRLPDSHTIHEFRDHLFNKRNLVSGDDRRWKLDHPEIPQKIAKIYNINKLDAGFFGFHYRQADIMDPMMRKFLETAIEAVMDAGMNPSELEGTKTGVFVGACYADMEIETLFNITQPHRFGVTGYLRSFIANRLSYYFKLKGPSFILDTACSSSSNALEAAFKAMRNGKCEQALVGGANLLIHPAFTRQFYRLGVLSSDGVCKPFDQDADGYVRGETVACIFMQKAKNTRRIYGQIIHTKVNDDGFKPLGITYPSSEFQDILITEILQDSGIEPSDIDFLEAHSTGTEVGDPQEIIAIDSAIAKKRSKPLLVGSVKCNIGHTEPSSGLCSLIKVIIAMETGFIPPNINIKNIKKGLEGFEQGRMVVVTEATKLSNDKAIIGINNFGFGGNNVHILVKRFNKIKINKGIPDDDLPRLVCVSGRTKEAVSALLEELRKTKLDAEYVGLLHQIFKKNVKTHIYRGYAIVTRNNFVKSDLNFFSQPLPALYVFFGHSKDGYKKLKQNLMKFSIFKNTVEKIYYLISRHLTTTDGHYSEKLQHIFDFFTVQIGLIHMLRRLSIEPTAVYGVFLEKIIRDYCHCNIDLEEAVRLVCELKGKLEIRPCIAYPYQKYLTNNGNAKILTVSDSYQGTKNELFLDGMNEMSFLEVLGKLYEEGYNPQIQNLYPEIKFPVSRTTPMISPLIKWDYRKNWYTYKFGDSVSTSNIYQKEQIICLRRVYDEQIFLKGHVIDGRNLVPAIEFLNLVWKTYSRAKNIIDDNIPIVFENCRFVRAVNIPKTKLVRFLVSIQKGSGHFEVTEGDSLVVSGYIYFPENHEKYQTGFSTLDYNFEDRTEFLDKDEIYRELYLRGYNYSGLFKGVVKCNVDASVGLIQWENNWTTFIDKMLQVKILQMDTRLLYVPVGIQKLVIHPTKHSLFTSKCPDQLCPVYCYKESDIVRCGEIEIHGIKAISISRRRPPLDPVLEKNLFIPNVAKLSLKDSARVNTQIILENNLEITFRAVEILDDFSKPETEFILPLISNALEDVPLVTLNLTISTKDPLENELPGIKIENYVLTSTSNLSLIVGSKIFQRSTLLNQINSALGKNGFILTREEIDFVAELQDYEILTEHVVSNEKLILFRKTYSGTDTKFIEISSKQFDWIPVLQEALKSANRVVTYTHNFDSEGILGLVNCIRREPGGNKVSCFFMMDDAPKFNPQDDFYSIQIKKHAAFNIYKDGNWGTYRHLLLDDVKEIENEHFFVNTTVKGDLSSLKWLQGSLHSKISLEDEESLVFTHYCAINFKDIMVASGRVNIDAISSDRLEQECLLGLEFCGVDTKGRRVIGMTNKAALSNLVLTHKLFMWEIPDSWSFEDAATVTVVYLTVIYALFEVIKLKPGKSILIHSATGGIGLAALNVCLYHGYEIYCTVGTQEKRDFLKKHYPQIPENHIGNSRDTSFEEMIKKETKGRGVEIVLNSLSEEKLRASIRCMAAGGDFLEIGKFDMGIDSSLNLLLLENKVTFHGVMLDRIYTLQSSEAIKFLRDAFYKGMKLGYVKPLPRTTFERNEIEKAFRYMMTGKHIGKVLIKIRDDDNNISTNQIFKGNPRFCADPQKAHIIIGGLGGFGLELADWLFLRGAEKLILVSRSGIQNGYQKQRIKFWQSKGVTVEISTKDVTTKAGCIDLIKETTKLGPIDSIFNLAVVLKDSLFENQNEESFQTAFAPKAQATKFLDEVTREFCPYLRHFVIFSSVSCGRGNPGQTNYGMANSVMERICEKRKQDGLPALAIQWGAIGDVGLVAKMQKENRELVIGGTLQQKVSSCLEVLDKFLYQDSSIVSSMVVAEKNAKSYGSGSAVDAVAYILGIKDIKRVGYNTTFAELGMDSMMGSEMIQILEKDFGIYLTAKDVRNMTFATLLEIENKQKETPGAAGKTELGVNSLLQCIPRPHINFTPLVNMSSKVDDNEKAPIVFVLPGIDGLFTPLEPLIRNLNGHVYAVNYKFHNFDRTIEECARNILDDIEDKVTKEETFFIIAYSYGTIVGTELTALLEAKGYILKFITIEGSAAYLKHSINDVFQTRSVAEFETVVLFEISSVVIPINIFYQKKDEFIKCRTLDERLDLALTLLPPDAPKKEYFDREGVTVLYTRFKAVLDYNFEHQKLKSPTYLFKAKFPMFKKIDEDYKLSEFFEEVVEVTVLDGDHSTVLNEPLLAEGVNKLLII